MAPLVKEGILVIRYNGQRHCLGGACHQTGEECKLSLSLACLHKLFPVIYKN